MSDAFPKLRIRIVLRPGVAFGPGKADLLQGIAETGSLSAAGRRLGMSYKRAWTLIGDLNRSFSSPLVETEKGGAGGGGARLTPLGADILTRFRAIEGALATAAAGEIAALATAAVLPLEQEKKRG